MTKPFFLRATLVRVLQHECRCSWTMRGRVKPTTPSASSTGGLGHESWETGRRMLLGAFPDADIHHAATRIPGRRKYSVDRRKQYQRPLPGLSPVCTHRGACDSVERPQTPEAMTRDERSKLAWALEAHSCPGVSIDTKKSAALPD